jgi:hypothetical protein
LKELGWDLKWPKEEEFEQGQEVEEEIVPFELWVTPVFDDSFLGI